MSQTASCPACGAPLAPGTLFCPRCGAGQPQGQLQGQPHGDRGVGPEPRRGFATSIAICFRRYAVFSGRAPRAEFWYFMLFTILVQAAASAITYALSGEGEGIVTGIIDLAFLLPGISVQVRRLHDLDRTGWWYWIALLPVIGWIVLIVWDCKRGTPGPNRYGADPLGGLPSAGYPTA